MLLLAMLPPFLAPADIPIHGATQLISNLSRLYFSRNVYIMGSFAQVFCRLNFGTYPGCDPAGQYADQVCPCFYRQLYFAYGLESTLFRVDGTL